MIEPRSDGSFEAWESLKPTLKPLLDYVGRYFLPWSQANAAALQAGQTKFSVELAGKTYTQSPQKYHAKSLQVIREKYRTIPDRRGLKAILEASDSARYLI
jgi:hypothetical protein